ncbi:nuclear transport factor 2 family protein [Rhabdothermincola salaria]|uniref:nuclear transport factor 2 family protein n=1 Tax=Rhabdothermincola salaria TaxID=2903142 RepID=UPI001E5B3846|nr:nuclear transport factor 2 family protein [Rhabdothermincola salaria]
MIQPADVQNLLGKWWFAYDNALFDEWPAMFTSDAHFTCRTDTGTTDYEEFVRADVSGHADVLAWQTQHRLDSPHPLRHNGENVHLTSASDDEAAFRSYIWVTQIVGGAPSPLSTAIVDGTVRVEEGELRIGELNVILDTQESIVLAERRRQAG